jgi:Tol biopolymer transport system component
MSLITLNMPITSTMHHAKERTITSSKVLILTALSIWQLPPVFGQHPVGIFEDHADIGAVGAPGAASFDLETGVYTITASGSNMWFDEDQFHFVWRRVTGDFILHAMGDFEGEGVDPHRKYGWIVRSNLSDSSRYVDIAVHGDGLTSMQYRPADGADTEELQSSVVGADVIQLARTGDTYTASVARAGDPFTSDRSVQLDLGPEVYVGLFLCAHNNEVRETARFRNVDVIIPAPVDFVPYQDFIGANLETVDVESGHRTVLVRSPHPIQAPNWTPDGRTLIYNDRGLLYRFDLGNRQSAVLNTGFADQNNNDHVLSFDGSRIAISHHAAEYDGESIIYTLPIEGGDPTQVTPQGPSYLHGWSPNGDFLVYTALRDGVYNICKIPTDGCEEFQLTDTPGLDDGPEYSPDGAYIYFNSTRSGRMKLWRMRPDGTNPEQLTFDELNDWFPHISPDGKWMAFLSYESDVDPSDHPYYKQAYLRLLPVDRPEGVTPKVIAYVYGGQGTMNVPSWSPDSRRVAFVSNTAMNRK